MTVAIVKVSKRPNKFRFCGCPLPQGREAAGNAVWRSGLLARAALADAGRAGFSPHVASLFGTTTLQQGRSTIIGARSAVIGLVLDGVAGSGTGQGSCCAGSGEAQPDLVGCRIAHNKSISVRRTRQRREGTGTRSLPAIITQNFKAVEMLLYKVHG